MGTEKIMFIKNKKSLLVPNKQQGKHVTMKLNGGFRTVRGDTLKVLTQRILVFHSNISAKG
jgi:hypothetical protein